MDFYRETGQFATSESKNSHSILTHKESMRLGRGDEVVRVLAFYSNDPSSNPADVYSFFL